MPIARGSSKGSSSPNSPKLLVKGKSKNNRQAKASQFGKQKKSLEE
jgi:hypothetical protein